MLAVANDTAKSSGRPPKGFSGRERSLRAFSATSEATGSRQCRQKSFVSARSNPAACTHKSGAANAQKRTLPRFCISLLTRLRAAHRVGQGEPKYGAARFIRLCPQTAPLGIDDGSANCQPHPHAALLRGVESVENALEVFRINARPRVAHCYEDVICLALFGANRLLAWTLFDRARCFDRIQDQVQDDLLQ
jgi:hypothetical protein